MSLFNEKIKKITLKELLILIIVLFLVVYFINSLNIVHIDSVWFYIFIIFYFIFKLRGEIPSIGEDLSQLLDPDLIRTILVMVILNIFLSYGMLYLSNWILGITPSFNFIFNSFLTGSLIVTVFISPVSEELIFRGVFLNRLQLIIPPLFAVLVSSLIFASLHGFGSIFSAFVFGICLSLLYLKTGNILAAMLAHFLNNLLAEVIVVFDSGNILFTNAWAMGLMSVLAIVSFIALSYSIVGQLKKLNNDDL